MEAVAVGSTNRIMVADGCNNLPVTINLGKNPPEITSVWQLSTEEVIRLLGSGRIALTILGTKHPPVRLDVLE